MSASHPNRSSEAQERLALALEGASWSRTRVRLLLGTDAFIDQERRVALMPRHLEELRRDLDSLGLELEVAVVAGAGARCEPPVRDEDYRAAGAEVVSVTEAASLPAFDVVHALKEPTDYEATLAGPFLRLGALHLASKPSGVCRMAKARNFAAILDGATVGSCAYRLVGHDRTPIVGSMSRFAGSVSGQKVVEALERGGVEAGTMVVVGGGIAGRSAIRKLGPKTRRLIVVEAWEPTRQHLRTFLPEAGFEDFEIVESLTDDALVDAVGVVFAHRTGARAAERVCRIEQIRTMRRGAGIADIAIDQGGSIAHEGYDETDDAGTAREKYIELLGEDFAYYAEVNMPREEPTAASETHGDSSLPYVTALLALCAQHGDPSAASEYLLQRPVRAYGSEETLDLDFLQAIHQDLRNGTQIAVRRREGDAVAVTDPEVARDEPLTRWLMDCAG
ncbi:MAG: hypothetical protein AAF725_17470 [Acidobacteriota bacterium]